ncbi:MAG: cupredoxin family copper-binding protein [Bacteroidota bacterium]|nr:cupredoxin family copper-binding protein [Bacteroidota bacterium]
MKTISQIRHRLSTLLAIPAIAILILAGCSKSDNNTNGNNGGNNGGNKGGKQVTIVNFAFSPATLSIAAGDTVVWTNKDGIVHTVTSTGGVFDSKSLANNATFSYIFKNAGTFDYYCTIHPYMTGKVIVQ